MSSYCLMSRFQLPMNCNLYIFLANLVVIPASQNVTLNSSVEFFCQAENTYQYDWYFNATISGLLSREYLQHIVLRNYPNAGGRLSSLFIPGVSLYYHQIQIRCVAHPRDLPSVTSPPGLLLIQGKRKITHKYNN